MTAQYATEDDLTNAKLGVKLDDLGPGQIESYLTSASQWVEEQCQRRFDHRTIVETLRTGGAGRAVIGGTGPVLLYPVQGFPIDSVSQIRWRTRGLPISALSANAMATSSSGWNVVGTDFYSVEADHYGDGDHVAVFVNFNTFRSPSVNVEFEVSYDAGYTTYPTWLINGTLQYACHLLKKRGASSLVLNGQGVVMDPSTMGGHLAAARDYLRGHKRIF